MSGHSKWATIRRKKGAADAKRGQLFSKLARAVIVAAREGGADPEANLALANAIEKARAASMPKENIERAIARGAGAGADANAYETVTYEGYGPGGVALFVEALAELDGDPVLLREGRILVAAFHPELTDDGRIHELFLDMVREDSRVRA